MNLFSTFETTLLDHQIKKKELKIKELKNEAKKVPYLKLPFKDKRKLVRHYKKKLKFYALQDSTKWQQWPVKTLTKINSKKEQT